MQPHTVARSCVSPRKQSIAGVRVSLPHAVCGCTCVCVCVGRGRTCEWKNCHLIAKANVIAHNLHAASEFSEGSAAIEKTEIYSFVCICVCVCAANWWKKFPGVLCACKPSNAQTHSHTYKQNTYKQMVVCTCVCATEELVRVREFHSQINLVGMTAEKRISN